MESIPSINTGMCGQSPAALIGCVINVSDSMRTFYDTRKGNNQAVEHLSAVLSAALQLAKAEERQDPNALMFLGMTGLKDKAVSVVDMYSLGKALLQPLNHARTGHERLIALARENDVAYVKQYIQAKLSEDDACIIHRHLSRHPEKIQEFIEAIPKEEVVRKFEVTSRTAATLTVVGTFMAVSLTLNPLVGLPLAYYCGHAVSWAAEETINRAVDNSKAMRLARKISEDGLLDFGNLEARPLSQVIPLLESLQNHNPPHNVARVGCGSLLYELRPYVYGLTRMQDAMRKVHAVFCQYSEITERIMVLMSDGHCDDDDPRNLGNELRRDGVTIAAVFLPNDHLMSHRQLYDEPPSREFNKNQQTFFDLASKVYVKKHPIPVLVSMGWAIPSSVRCSLYITACSSDILEEFCSLLLSSRLGSADALLDLVSQVHLDAYIDDKKMRTSSNPSTQDNSRICYVHATAAAVHMALHQSHGRQGSDLSFEHIRTDILKKFPKRKPIQSFKEVIRTMVALYPALQYQRVSEGVACEAVSSRRPVLATFSLTKQGWGAFKKYFSRRDAIIEPFPREEFDKCISSKSGSGGHAVLLVGCDPRSLTFLNSWGFDWGNNGTFSIAVPTISEMNRDERHGRMKFYDFFGGEKESTSPEQEPYIARVNADVRANGMGYPIIFEMKHQFPCCGKNVPVAHYLGDIRKALCPLCTYSFKPQPGHLTQALYAKTRLALYRP